ncbi:MAG: 3-methyl-2-oxobutanoate dehydrogenase subunit VorB [Bacillota bacterium]
MKGPEIAPRTMMKGNEALAEGALRGGCRFYFGYPITPQNELLEYMAVHLPRCGGVFLQTESELAAISMVYGVASTGRRAMTSSSSPGISLMQEGISYLASAELPCLIVNITRGSPGLGRITPAQSDYFQAVKGGGHGDYRLIVLAPVGVQEMADFACEAFELAERYRAPVMILGDGIVGQMMEPVRLPCPVDPGETPVARWAVGEWSRPRARRNLVLSAPLTDPELRQMNLDLQEKYHRIAQAETRYEAYRTEDAEMVIVAFGIAARLSMEAVDSLRDQGVRAGLLRPITLWPFPSRALEDLSGRVLGFLVVEMNEGQMVEDVCACSLGRAPVGFLGGGGGFVPTPAQIAKRALSMLGGVPA